MVAGVTIDLGGEEFWLRHCPVCRFQFKYPAISQELLLACYAQAGDSHGGYAVDPHSRRFDLLKAMLEQSLRGRRVLDIGCYTGDFLHYLGKGWDLNGVEPSIGAAAVSRDKGINILGPTLEHLLRASDGQVCKFDAIVALDLIEHLADPQAFFRQVSSLLAPDGALLLLTGDTGSLSWTLQKSLYWYCSLPEHCSFYSRPTIKFLGDQHGLVIKDYYRKSHWRQQPQRIAWDWARNSAYSIARSARGFGLRAVREKTMTRGAPGWLSASDHMFCLMIKR
jgi:SAM-dependent methyltransferase